MIGGMASYESLLHFIFSKSVDLLTKMILFQPCRLMALEKLLFFSLLLTRIGQFFRH